MTLSTADNVARYAAGEGQTEFAFGFRVDADSHMQIYIDGALQAGGYAVTGIGDDNGGNVSFTAPPRQPGDPDRTVTLLRKVPLTQTTDLPTQGALPTEAIEDELDRLVMRTQQLDEVDKRSFKVPVESTVGGSGLELTPAASKLIGWDGAGARLANYASSSLTPGIVPTAFMEALLGENSAAEVRASLGLSMVPAELTVSGGSIAPTADRLHFTVDTNSDDANDDLDNIATTNVPDGSLIYLRGENSARVVTVRHGVGNIRLIGDSNLDLLPDQALMLQRRGTVWHEVRGKGLVGVKSYGTSVTWVRPVGVTHVLVMVIGGGGGGGALTGVSNYRSSSSGSTGSIAVGFYDVSGHSSIAVTIGAGGAGGTASGPGGTGGSSTFGNLATGTGGNGGQPASSGAPNPVSGSGASGGNIKNIIGATGWLGTIIATGSTPTFSVVAGSPIPPWPFGPGGIRMTSPHTQKTNIPPHEWPGQGGFGRAATPADTNPYDGGEGESGYCVVLEYSL